MKRTVRFLVSAVMLTAFTAYVHAQDPIRIELADISIGTGLEDGRLCALMSESFLESDEGLSLVERMNSCLTDNSYREMASQHFPGTLQTGKLPYNTF